MGKLPLELYGVTCLRRPLQNGWFFFWLSFEATLPQLCDLGSTLSRVTEFGDSFQIFPLRKRVGSVCFPLKMITRVPGLTPQNGKAMFPFGFRQISQRGPSLGEFLNLSHFLGSGSAACSRNKWQGQLPDLRFL